MNLAHPLWLYCLCASIAQAAPESLEAEAGTWLRDQFEYIPCDGEKFIYGVGYIDGSYMERIFLATGDGNTPELEVRFRDHTLHEAVYREQVSGVPFVLELRISGARHASLNAGDWRAQPGFDTALRFKYTSWFGELSWREGQWQVQWRGYRRPMMPRPLVNQPGKACDLFEQVG